MWPGGFRGQRHVLCATGHVQKDCQDLQQGQGSVQLRASLKAGVFEKQAEV